jgi:PAS domain S-box-containing protein
MEASVSSQFKNPTVQRYALAVLVAAIALVLREVFSGWFGNSNPFHTVWAAVVFSAWYCGVGPAIVTTVLSLIGVWYLFIPTLHSFHLEHPKHAITGLVGFAVLSGLIIAIGEANRRLRQSLMEARGELEQRVRERTAELAEKATLLDMANDAILVKSANGKISYWNEGAERLYGWAMNEAIGHSLTELLHSEYPIPLAEIESGEDWEGEIHHTKRDGSWIVVASRWTKIRDKSGNAMGWLEINTDITARKQAEEAARKLSGRILILQDEERRRIARGLHDSLGQYLTALKMNLDLLSATDGKRFVSECSEIVDKCLTETRTISHLLHPPLLDEAGFGSAARWYVDGFAERSGIKVNLSLPPELGRLHEDVETALFRAVQEGLTNVHRHSCGSVVNIQLTMPAKQVELEIKDNGQGIPPKTLKRLAAGTPDTGVGIAGMRARVRELGGWLRIKSDKNGTLLRIVIPVSEMAQKPVDGDHKTTEGVSAA